MKSIYISFLLLFYHQCEAQDTARIKTFELPNIKTIIFDFEIVEDIFSLIPVNGGLFCPESNSWYRVPDNRIYQSVSYDPADSSVSYSILADKKMYISTSRIEEGRRQTDSVWIKTPGIYFVKRINRDTTIFGGYSNNSFSVFQLTDSKETLLFSFKGKLSNLQFESSSSFFFQYGNKIYYFKKGFQPLCIYSSKHNIDGFTFDKKGSLYISRKEGIFRIKRETVELVLPYAHGMLKVTDNFIYVLSVDNNTFVRYQL